MINFLKLLLFVTAPGEIPWRRRPKSFHLMTLKYCAEGNHAVVSIKRESTTNPPRMSYHI